MSKIIVYHPENVHRNAGSTAFLGENLSHSISPEGELTISNWQTETEQGEGVFARGQWTYMSVSRSYKPLQRQI